MIEMSGSVTYPVTRDDLYAMMGSELTARIATQVEDISVLIIEAATAGLCCTTYSTNVDIPEYTIRKVNDRFPDCIISYTSSSSLEIRWV